MRRTVRVMAGVGAEQRLAGAVRTLPPSAQRALAAVADREDLPLVAGSWSDGGGGCLVANAVQLLVAQGNAATDSGSEPGSDPGFDPGFDPGAATLDLRILELLPELSSRDLNRLIVAWDEAALQEGVRSDAQGGDGALRRLLRGALAAAGVPTGDGGDTVAAAQHAAAAAGAAAAGLGAGPGGSPA